MKNKLLAPQSELARDVIKIIEDSKYKDVFNIWRYAREVSVVKEEPSGVYYGSHSAKIRFIDSLVWD